MRHALLTSIAACALLGCTTPFATEINQYDLSNSQQPASIVLSDPQVYARETLVNDRRDEAEYLRGVLNASSSARFTPQLRRDLETLTGFIGQMNLIYDPAAGSNFERRDELLDQQHEINRINAEAALYRARAALTEERRRYEAIERGEAPAAGATPNAPSPGEDERDELPTLTELDEIVERMNEITTLVQRAGAMPRDAGVTSSPQEEFRDRQTYREEIRSAIADVNLDDGHDIEGNALYRLQFRATVMPGQHRGQFGVARLTFAPPVLTDREVAELYLSWLAYVNRELNQTRTQDDTRDAPLVGLLEQNNIAQRRKARSSLRAELQLIGIYTDLFDVVPIDLTNTEDSRLIAAPANAAAILRHAICEAKTSGDCGSLDFTTIRGAPITAPAESLPFVAAQPRCATTEHYNIIQNRIASFDEVRRGPQLALSSLVTAAQAGVIDSVEAANLSREVRRVQGQIDEKIGEESNRLATGFRSQFDPTCPTDQRLDELLRQLQDTRGTIFVDNPHFTLGDTFYRFRNLIEDPRDVSRPADERDDADARAGATTPLDFLMGQRAPARRTTREAPRQYNNRPVPRGDIAAFFARPVDQSQRISSVQGAANAIDLALALRAQTGRDGVSGAAGANYVRQAVGRIDTIERAPIVVGFNDRIESGHCNDPSGISGAMDCHTGGAIRTLAQSGWVLGPRISPGGDGQSLEARQNVVNHALSTDLSVPGWWPRVQARLETAWIGNWNADAEGEVFGDDNDRAQRIFNIDLPHNSADMRALTRLVSGLGAPLASPQLTAVTPSYLRICPQAETLRLQVVGRDVWQGSEAFLNGVSASSVRILPDMGGLDLEFSTANLQLDAGGEDNATLVVWTRDGQTDWRIRVDNVAANSPFCRARAGGGGAAAAAGAAALTPNRTWLAPGERVQLQFPDAAVLAQGDLQIRMQRYDTDTNSTSGPIVELASHDNDPASVSIGERGLVAFTVSSNADHTKAIPNGSLVEISAMIISRNGNQTVITSPRRTAFFSAAQQARLSPDSIIVRDPARPFELIAELPLRADLRYSGLAAGSTPSDPTRMLIRGSATRNGDTFQFESVGPWAFQGLNTTSRQPSFSTQVRVAGGNDRQAAFAAAITAAGTGGIPARFELVINGQVEVRLHNASVKN